MSIQSGSQTMFKKIKNYVDKVKKDIYTVLDLKANDADLSKVAKSGEYEDLLNKPDLKAVATSGEYDDLLNKPDLKAVATSGEYEDLLNKPDLKPVATSGEYEDLLNKPDLKPVATSGNYNDLENKPALKPVATSGNYNDLENKPALKPVATSADYNDLKNTPKLSTVATSGSYNDLLHKPILSTVANTGDYNDLLHLPDLHEFKNKVEAANEYNMFMDLLAKYTKENITAQEAIKGDINEFFGTLQGQIGSLSKVATTGEYDDLLNLPDLSLLASKSNVAALESEMISELNAFQENNQVSIDKIQETIDKLTSDAIAYIDRTEFSNEVSSIRDDANEAFGRMQNLLNDNDSKISTLENGLTTVSNASIVRMNERSYTKLSNGMAPEIVPDSFKTNTKPKEICGMQIKIAYQEKTNKGDTLFQMIPLQSYIAGSELYVVSGGNYENEIVLSDGKKINFKFLVNNKNVTINFEVDPEINQGDDGFKFFRMDIALLYKK